LRQLPVPNSVTNWVNGLAISPDGQTAFVVDTRGGLPRTVQQVKDVFADLPAGGQLYAIDIRDLANPKLVGQVAVGSTPVSVSVNPVNQTLLICGMEKGKEIVLVDWKNGKFGPVRTYPQAGKTTHANWHPSGKFFGLTLEETKQVVFYQVENGQAKPLGQPVDLGGFPGAALFSPNGRYYLVPNLRWDQGYDLPGEIIVVEFAENGQPQVRSRAQVGISPEGIAISPNGRWVASSNMGTNFLPHSLPLFGHRASVSLLGFDQATGTLTLHDTQAWEGVLPEGIAFDADSDALVTTSFDYLDLAKRQGGLHFWQLKDQNGKATLHNTGFKLTVQRGCHFVKIIY
ncbi:MAG: lactonase family protein, partial [Bernardetiaceae bacterium]|nr:lactonase family protein [Bernardetiaceae bacterium]